MEKKRKDEGDEIMTMAATVQKWGNSLAIRIPKDVADKIRIQQGSEMEMKVMGQEKITLVPKKPVKKYSLEELLSQITPENRHDEIDLGVEGNELI